MVRQAVRLVEGLTLFVGLPLFFYWEPIRLPKIPCLLILALYALLVLRLDLGFEQKRLLRASALRPFLRATWPRMLAVLSGLTALAFVLVPGQLFGFPRQRPGIWLLVMALYPLLSAYPQELIFRTFFFRRYESFFGRGAGMVWASALAFAFLHIIYDNVVAVCLSVLGGWLFALTYRRTGSTLAATFEHAIYGCWVFTVGLGRFFYEGR
jgi:membrane protease YdiL (CAAX protease family)